MYEDDHEKGPCSLGFALQEHHCQLEGTTRRTRLEGNKYRVTRMDEDGQAWSDHRLHAERVFNRQAAPHLHRCTWMRGCHPEHDHWRTAGRNNSHHGSSRRQFHHGHCQRQPQGKRNPGVGESRYADETSSGSQADSTRCRFAAAPSTCLTKEVSIDLETLKGGILTLRGVDAATPAQVSHRQREHKALSEAHVHASTEQLSMREDKLHRPPCLPT